MASYRDKINQEQLETESGKIAWCIVWMEGHWPWKKDFYLNGCLDLFDGSSEECHYSYKLYKSKEPGAYILVRSDAFSDWSKIVPTDCDWLVYKNVLDAQPWSYI